MRRARTRRHVPPRLVPGPQGAVVTKAALQEQGQPLLPRLLAIAGVSGTVLAAAARVTPGPSPQATVVWSLVAAGGLTVLATRCADPVRLDVDRAPLAAAVPLPHALIARLDLVVSAVVAMAGTLLGAVGATALGVVPAAEVADVVLGAVALAVLLSAAGALGALSDDPNPMLPPQVAVGYRTSGLIAVVVACVGAATALRYQAPDAVVTGPQPDRMPQAALLLLVVGVVAGGLAVFRARGALTRGR